MEAKKSSIQMSEYLKAEIRTERRGKESYEETVYRLLEERKALRGEYGENAQALSGYAVSLKPVLHTMGITEEVIVKAVTSPIKEFKKAFALKARADTELKLFKGKMDLITKAAFYVGLISLLLLVTRSLLELSRGLI